VANRLPMKWQTARMSLVVKMELPREEWESYAIKGFANFSPAKVAIVTQSEFSQLANGPTAAPGLSLSALLPLLTLIRGATYRPFPDSADEPDIAFTMARVWPSSLRLCFAAAPRSVQE
jgi:hypothetical protein